MQKKTTVLTEEKNLSESKSTETGVPLTQKGKATPKYTFSPMSVRSQETSRLGTKLVVTTLALFGMAVVGVAGYGVSVQMNMEASPIVAIMDPYNKNNSSTMEYGPHVALAQDAFYSETRAAFIDESLTFIEVDISERMLRFFKKGVLFQSAPVLSIGEKGSWWETPSGLYKIERKTDSVLTNISQVNLPWQLTFQGNFAIHGWPTQTNGLPVSADFAGGGIRLSDEAARALFAEIKLETPVLVHASAEQVRDTFVYEPQVPELDTPHYFIADLDNGTILAATDLEESVPIASLVKLMTAVVAAEKIDLNGRIRVTSPTFVTSLIPRLAERSSVSMYSLLQLLLVESSNEAAETIAGEVGRVVFIEAMNAKARQLGMMKTNFSDPSGLSAENTSTLGDLYILTEYIKNNRSFIFDITANKKVSGSHVDDEFAGLVNFNKVKDMDSFVGGKVGETLAAGKTSISVHRLKLQGEDRTVAVIILGSEQRTADVKILIDYVRNQFSR